MILQKNQLVEFENGHKAGNLEAIWNERRQAFCYASDELDENGNRIIYYSTKIIEKPKREKRKFVPDRKNCTVQIYPDGETEKAYRIPDGTNGKIGRSTCREYYKWIAKSVCYTDEQGNIFAPAFAI